MQQELLTRALQTVADYCEHQRELARQADEIAQQKAREAQFHQEREMAMQQIIDVQRQEIERQGRVIQKLVADRLDARVPMTLVEIADRQHALTNGNDNA